MTETEHDISVMISEKEIAERVHGMAEEVISSAGGDLLVVVILKGSFVFAADLIRALERAGGKPRVDFMMLSSYGTGTKSSGNVQLIRDLSGEVADQHVLIVDDILESGNTLAYAKNLLQERGAKQVSTCMLLEKPGKRQVDIQADYVGFVIEDRFVVGYGLDLASMYRGLPFIGEVSTG